MEVGDDGSGVGERRVEEREGRGGGGGCQQEEGEGNAGGFGSSGHGSLADWMGQSQDAVEFIAMQGSGSGVRLVGAWIQGPGRSS